MLAVRAAGRHLASTAGFSSADATIVATMVSELAHQVLRHSGRGEIRLETLVAGERCGIVITACDPRDSLGGGDRAAHGGSSTLEGFRDDLAAVRRWADEFRLITEVGKGTLVAVTKWNW